MKAIPGTVGLLGALLVSGCDTLYQAGGSSGSSARYDAARVEMSRQQTARDVGALKAQAEATGENIQRLDARLDRIESETRLGGATRAELDALRRDVDALRADRVQLRREIVDELSREMGRLLAAQAAPPARSSVSSGGGTPSGGTSTAAGRQSGWEHKVQAGQTLSEIAKAYNVSTASIQKANALKDDRIRVGQVLFIPE